MQDGFSTGQINHKHYGCVCISHMKNCSHIKQHTFYGRYCEDIVSTNKNSSNVVLVVENYAVISVVGRCIAHCLHMRNITYHIYETYVMLEHLQWDMTHESYEQTNVAVN